METCETAKVGLYESLYILGNRDALSGLIGLLNSTDYRVRCASANAVSAFEVRRPTSEFILRALRVALSRETTVAARRSITASIVRVGEQIGKKRRHANQGLRP